MSGYTKWYYSCKGSERELALDPRIEEDSLEPTCPPSGATPSSDPRRTLRSQECPEEPD